MKKWRGKKEKKKKISEKQIEKGCLEKEENKRESMWKDEGLN